MSSNSIPFDLVSIHLYRTGILLESALRQRVSQTEKCLLIVNILKTSTDLLGDLQARHRIGGTGRTNRANLQRFREGVHNYLFVRLANLTLAGDLSDVNVLIYDDSLLRQLPIVTASTIDFFLMERKFFLSRGIVPEGWRPIFNTIQPPVFHPLSNYCQNRFVSLDRIHKISNPLFPFPDMRDLNPVITDYLRLTFEEQPCQYCGAVRIRGRFMRCCEGYENSIVRHLPPPMPLDILQEISHFIQMNNPNFPRTLNRFLRPVLQYAKIASPKAAASTIFINGIPYGRDSSNQFLIPVYAVFNALERQPNRIIRNQDRIIQKILLLNPTLRIYLRERLDKAVKNISCSPVDSTDPGINLAILTDAICTESAEWRVVTETYRLQYVDHRKAEYDQLVYPLIFGMAWEFVVRSRTSRSTGQPPEFVRC
jgi:hypothetical protein